MMLYSDRVIMRKLLKFDNPKVARYMHWFAEWVDMNPSDYFHTGKFVWFTIQVERFVR